MTATGFQSQTIDIALVSSKKSLDNQATIECRFTLKRVRDIMTHNYQKFFKKI